MSRLADYFVVVGYDFEKENKGYDFDKESMFTHDDVVDCIPARTIVGFRKSIGDTDRD